MCQLGHSESNLVVMMMFIGTETLVTQFVNERPRVHASRSLCDPTIAESHYALQLPIKRL
jgi:hypothetical protein